MKKMISILLTVLLLAALLVPVFAERTKEEMTNEAERAMMDVEMSLTALEACVDEMEKSGEFTMEELTEYLKFLAAHQGEFDLGATLAEGSTLILGCLISLALGVVATMLLMRRKPQQAA